MAIAVQPLAFGRLLKHYRIQAGLTQEELAERANLSTRAVSDLERGVRRTPHKDTAALLADALQLVGAPREMFIGTARGRLSGAVPPGGVVPLRTPSHIIRVPSAPTPLIGRDADMAAVTHALRRSDVRLLTLRGPAGIGKTRLGTQVALDMAEEFDDGAILVALATIREPDMVMPTIAEVLGLRESRGQSAVEHLAEYLRDKRLLLLLDNFEQVIGAAPLIADLLAACPHLKVLVTSRIALNIRFEYEYPVPLLSLPNPSASSLAEAEIERSAAVALFVERARAIKPDFTLTSSNAAAVAAVCRRLDGLPLAIELAAGWVKVLSPSALLARLERHLLMLSGGPRDLPERQQALRNAISWSYDLLTGQEQALLCRLSVFVGGCTIETLDAVAQDVVQNDVLDELSALVDKSMVQRVDQADGEPRFTLLEMIREYGLEQLDAMGARDLAQRRHATYFLDLAETAEQELNGPQQVEWLAHLEQERDNVRAVLQWAQAHGELVLGLRVAAGIWRFWQVRGYLSEGRDWLQKLQAAAENGTIHVPPTVRVKVLHAMGMLATQQGDFPQAEVLSRQSLELAQQLGDERASVRALVNLANVARYQGDYGHAVALYERSLALARQIDYVKGIADTLNNYGLALQAQGDSRRATTLFEDSLALHKELGDHVHTAFALTNLGMIEHAQRHDARAMALLTEGLELARALDDKPCIAYALVGLGDMARLRCEYELAEALLGESLTLARELGSQNQIAQALLMVGAVCGDRGDYQRALAIFTEGVTLGQRIQYAPILVIALTCKADVARLLGAYEQATMALENALLLARRLGGPGRVLASLGHIAREVCDYERAEALLTESLTLAQDLGYKESIAYASTILALVRHAQGDDEHAVALLEKSLALVPEEGDRQLYVCIRFTLGLLLHDQGQDERASALLEESLVLSQRVSNPWLTACCLQSVAYILAQRAPNGAGRLLGAAMAIRSAAGTPLSPADQVIYNRTAGAIRERLGDEAFAVASSQGAALSLEQAVAEALASSRQLRRDGTGDMPAIP